MKFIQALQTKTVNLLKEFRGLNAGQFRAPNKMILPDSAPLLPLWTLGLIKVSALRGSARDVNADERIAVGFEMMSSAVRQMAKLIYPNLYPVFDMTGAKVLFKAASFYNLKPAKLREVLVRV